MLVRLTVVWLTSVRLKNWHIRLEQRLEIDWRKDWSEIRNENENDS